MNVHTQYIDQLADSWHHALIPFVRPLPTGPKGTTKGEVFGTGFLVKWRHDYALVTAAHVVTAAKKSSIVVLDVNGFAVQLAYRKFVIFGEADLAVSLFTDQDLGELGVQKIKAIPLFKDRAGQQPQARSVGMGYPSTQNQLNTAHGKIDKTSLIFSVLPAEPDARTTTTISKPLLFTYEPSQMLPGRNRAPNSTAPDLHGISGGPIFQLYVTEFIERADLDPAIRRHHVGLELEGVLVEWRKSEKLLVAVSKGELVQLLDCFA
jgi:hypothetical protein